MSAIRKIRYNCRQATLLLEKREFTKLSFREVIELRIHLAGCSVCRLYNKQSRAINTMVQQLFKSTEYKLDDDYKAQLKLRINEEMEKE